MNIKELMKEYSFELNDVRWYLANNIALECIEMSNRENDLTSFISSGELEARVYNMEERFIEDLQDLSDRNRMDESNIRDIFNNIYSLKLKRNKN
ncbi:hypothetical protein EW093_16540 [Thiospirochaeta perfilievii]|uniref:Uncharacterized protein n=1 Tax=Thiospirochaeta perfilievii TaxID=252967 RepID=A0A5C1QFN4_9SPIO|nr:hypothetical protein [Thiospirochaeta perfilievii]QEN06227.1 hypothetical protein EW093_16540 [Thiospirochaeta perfilievii]